jgi:tRNA (cytidine/uridine-2'-O-)-methyltransferase
MPRVVLVQPQIPPNTGNVARTCAATGAELHLVDPLGFEISDRQLKRAGLDYWPLVQLQRHGDLGAFWLERERRGGRRVALSARAQQSYTEFRFAPDDWLLFGCESDGLPDEALRASDACLTIPMAPRQRQQGEVAVRSLNLSVAVAVVLFEALRQLQPTAAPGIPD